MEQKLDKILEEYEEGNMNLITLKAKLLHLFSVSNRLTPVEVINEAHKWLNTEIIKNQDDFTEREKYWIISGFEEGYNKAVNGC